MLFGVCGGMTYVVPMNIAWQYFPGREGLITGVIDSSFGMGGAMFGHLMSRMINPEHIDAWEENEMHPYPFEENIASNLPKSLKIVAVIWAVIVMLAVFMMRPPPIQIASPKETDRLSVATEKLVNADIEDSEISSHTDN